MEEVHDQLNLIELFLEISFPKVYKDSFAQLDFILPPEIQILRPELTLDLDTIWGATEFLRLKRPDVGLNFAAIFQRGESLICLDLKDKNLKDDAPVFEINPFTSDPPKQLRQSFKEYLECLQVVPKTKENRHHPADPWFLKGLSRLKWHMKNLSFQYDHKTGGKLPRNHLWRPYRFCVQDVVLGITVIRHDRKFNRLEVDVFLTASIDEYESDSGCRALALILLSDAYKSGGSMEIKFTEHVEGGRVPQELCELADKLGVSLKQAHKGGITPREAKELYLALTHFSSPTRKKIMQLENEGRLSAGSVCYAVHHGIWTSEELESIIFTSHAPESILKGSYPPELWHLFHYDLLIGRIALMGGYLDRKLIGKEHSSMGREDTIVELEDDERKIEISFDPETGAKTYRLLDGEKPLIIPWLANDLDSKVLSPGQELLVLICPLESEVLTKELHRKLEQAIRILQQNPERIVCIMVPADFRRIHLPEVLNDASKNKIGLIVCPEFLNQIDQEVVRRFEAVKVMRQ